MEELLKKIKILDNKILKLSVELNELKKKETETSNKNSQEIRDSITEIRTTLKEIEYDRLNYICSLSRHLFNKELWKDQSACDHTFDIIGIKKKDECLEVKSKCLVCGYDESIYINKKFNSYEELIEYLNSNNENYKYIGGCAYIGALEDKKEKAYTLKK